SLFGFLQAVVLGRALGVEGYGLLAIVMALVTTVNQIVDVRMWETVTKFVGDDHERGDHGRARAMVKLAYLVDGATGLLAFGLVLVLSPWLAERFLHHREAASEVSLYAGTLLMATVNDTSMALLRVFDRFRWLTFERVASSIVRFIVLATVALTTHGLRPVLAAYVVVELGRGLVLLVLGLRSARTELVLPGPDHLALVRSRLGEFWHFTLNNSAVALLALITRQLDILLLTLFHAPREVGLYRMAKNFGLLIFKLSDPFYHAIYPELVRLAATSALADLRRFIARSMRIVLALLIPAGLVCILGADFILQYAVGREFAAAAWPLRFIVAGAMIHAAFLWARPLVLATGRPHWSTAAHVGGVVVMALGSLALVPRLGALGSAITFFLTSAVTVGIHTWGALSGHHTPAASTGVEVVE
ncbi:MAG TPA: oligosaccharide flippase family protein, partial [Candidatus Udaeobacter sp.]|nr:oligosaccharide flippase family protein [Candidatus Udaeobacter sp.]